MKRSPKFTSFILALASLLFFAKPSNAQIRNQIPVGTRPLSMGEAFVAVADDGNAISWNPAGLARMEHIQASFNYADLFGLNIDSYYANFLSRVYFIPPLTDYLAFGVDWSGINTGDEEFEFTRDQFTFALAFKPPQSWPHLRDLSIGANAKYLKLQAKLDPKLFTHLEADASGWGWDFGILYNLGAVPYLPEGINWGLMVHDAGGGTWVKHETKRKELIQRQNIRWGLSYRPFEEWPGKKIPLSDPVLAIDFDDRIHLGLEFWLAHTLALRAGLQKDLHTDENATFSFGLGFKKALKDYPGVTVDYALTDSPVLPNTNKQFGGSLILKDNPRLLRIEGAHIDNVFASLYQHYGLPGAKVGSIKLKNVSNDTLIAAISFQASRYMQPKPQATDMVVVPPGRRIDFPLRAVFDSTIFNARESRLTGEVKVTYEYQRNQHAATAGVDFALYGKNYMTWDDPGKAAAFITPEDPLVKAFVDKVTERESEPGVAQWFSRYRMTDALKLFCALQTYGIKYRPDPVTPFPSLADTLRGAHYRLDMVKYPAQLLSKKEQFGDCDDLAVLYASLLQNAGLPTALISVPGHIFMMFDTRIDTSRSTSLPVSPKLFVKWRETLWIPIETTMIPSSSFSEAWTTAAEAIDPSCRIYEVAAHQAKYPPVVFHLSDTLKPVPDFTSAMQKDLMAMETMKTQWLQQVEGMLVPGLPTLDAVRRRNMYGILLGQNDEYDRARKQFKKILQDSSTFAPAWNNLGNVEFISGNFTEAEKAYQKALECNRYSRGTYLNLAILCQLMKPGLAPKDTIEYQHKSEAALLAAAQILEGDSLSAFTLLQFPEERTDVKAGNLSDKVKKQIAKVKNFVDKSFKKYLQSREVRGIVLDRYGAKARGEVDEVRVALLAWIY
ncbi:MAG: tetratricopeptide repeat protein [candidate division KSB1 bacterium]|nr:tetratricopeptide repeat protein [candidate division KSB1 bacterium]MDZ7303327.1 tetratricopeptide repeat protein [candidate division KSB1 bacterium]MDZ7310423.1 tetratricopeptide repeat protein [candidate division KSB1 bacterium]